jgi:hypothetical protein
MTAQSHETNYPELTIDYWTALGAAGLLAGVLMGIVMYQAMGVMQAVGGLYGFAATGAGWVAHLVHAVLFGLVYGTFYMSGALRPFRTRVLASTTIGITWGVVLWVVAAGVIMPLWLGVVSFSASPPVPSLNPVSGLGHVLYGGVLGGVGAAFQKH